MKTVWIDRDGSNNIITLYGVEQRPGQEKLADDSQEVIDFRNPPPPTNSERIQVITGGSDLQIVMFKMLFRLHNRVLVLESKPTIDTAAFLTFLEGELP